MKVTLRKANALQAAIVESMASLELATDVAINEFEKPAAKLDEAKNKFMSNLNTRANLLSVHYEIRREVASANAASGINNLLANVAMAEKEILLYKKLSSLRPALDNDVIVGKLGKIKGRAEEAYYGSESNVNTTIFDSKEIDEFKTYLADLKRRKVTLQDSMLELNVKTEIEISDEAEQVLATVGII